MKTRAKTLKKSIAAKEGWDKQQQKNNNISAKLFKARQDRYSTTKRKKNQENQEAKIKDAQTQTEEQSKPKTVNKAAQTTITKVDAATQTAAIGRNKATQTIPSPSKVDQCTQTFTVFHLDKFSDVIELHKTIQDLDKENKELKKKHRKKPLKALENISTRRTNQIAKGIAEEIKNSRETTPEGLVGSKIVKRIEKNLSSKHCLLSPENDLAATLASGLTTKQRERLKHCFRVIGFDRFSPSTKVKELKKEWKKIASWDWINEAYVCLNVSEVLSKRLNTLSKFGQLRMHKQFNNNIFVTLMGDKGGKEWPSKSTKIGIIIGNVDKPNSPYNISLVSIYDGDDNRENLKLKLDPIIRQLEVLNSVTFNNAGVEMTLKIKWFVCSDLKFISAIYGHRGACSNHPCSKCLITKENLGTICGEPRTLQNLKSDALSDKNSIFGQPIISISPSQIVPPSLHLISGICQRIMDAISEYSHHSGRSIQEIFNEAHAKMDPRKRTFTGSALYHLITGPSREKLKKMLPSTQSSVILCRLLDTMKEIYGLANATFLDQRGVEQLKTTTTNLYKDIQVYLHSIDFKFNFKQLRTRFEALNLRGRLAGGQLKIFKPTPKLHMLCAHAPQFAEENGWWCWISEQGLEHLHSLYNKLAVQYCNTGDKNKTAEKLAQHQALLNALNDRGTMQKIII